MSVTEKWQPTGSWQESARRNWGVTVTNRTLQVNTKGKNDVQDLTRSLTELITKVNMRNGTVTLFVQGSTAGLTTIEYEPGVVSDLSEMFNRIAPEDVQYKHEARWNDGNGHSHIRAALLGPSLVIPFVDGQLTLGTWQQIVLVDFDTRPRQREIVAQFIGS
jgi:secondary thiamine-phosphate synthase enzyme